jgi:hypothetical protein
MAILKNHFIYSEVGSKSVIYDIIAAFGHIFGGSSRFYSSLLGINVNYNHSCLFLIFPVCNKLYVHYLLYIIANSTHEATTRMVQAAHVSLIV